MLTVIDYPGSFKEGVRVLHLLSRNKDKTTKIRTSLRVSHNPKEFDIHQWGCPIDRKMLLAIRFLPN